MSSKLEPLKERTVVVEKLSEENIELDRKLKEMQERIEAAEQRRAALAARRESRTPATGTSAS